MKKTVIDGTPNGIDTHNALRKAARVILAICIFCIACVASAQEGDRAATAKLRIIGLTGKSFVWVDGTLEPTPESEFLSLPLGSHRISVWEEGLLPIDNAVVTVREDDSAYIVFQRLESHLVRAKRKGAWATGAGIAGGLLTVGGVAAIWYAVESYDPAEDDSEYRVETYGPVEDDEALDESMIIGRAGFAAAAVGLCVDVYAGILGIRAGMEKSKHLDFPRFSAYAELAGK